MKTRLKKWLAGKCRDMAARLMTRAAKLDGAECGVPLWWRGDGTAVPKVIGTILPAAEFDIQSGDRLYWDGDGHVIPKRTGIAEIMDLEGSE